MIIDHFTAGIFCKINKGYIQKNIETKKEVYHLVRFEPPNISIIILYETAMTKNNHGLHCTQPPELSDEHWGGHVIQYWF